MKPRPGFDDELPLKLRPTHWPARSIGQLMIAVAASGLVLAVLAGMGKHKSNVRYLRLRAQRPVQGPQVKALGAQPRDPFMVMAAAEIDPTMVVPAPVGIDEGMVFNPEVGGRQPGLAAPPGYLPVPPAGQQPHPVPGGSSPPGRTPKPR
jgi:hypothetical protein